MRLHDVSSQQPAQDDGANESNPMSVFQSVSMIDVLEQDPRPAFVLDLFAYGSQSDDCRLKPIFCNASFRGQHGLLDVVNGQSAPDDYGQPSSSTYASFARWALERGDMGVPRGFIYDGMSWTSATINGRWKMVNAIRERQQGGSTGAFKKASWGTGAVATAGLSHKDSDGSQSTQSTAETQSSAAMFLQQAANGLVPRLTLDWTTSSPPRDASAHIMLARSVDWRNTPLGAMSSWSPCLRSTVNLLMSTPAPAIVLWGPDYRVLYNEAYIPVAGAKHPAAFGMPVKEGFAEAWVRFKPFLQQCKQAGRGATFEDMQFFLDRGLCDEEETYFNLTISPVCEDEASVTGFFEHIIETTARKVAERRMTTILELGEKTSKADDLGSFWAQVAASLASNPHDISFAGVYSVHEDTDRDRGNNASTRLSPSSKLYRMEQSIGVPQDHAAFPRFADAYNLSGLPCYFDRTYRSDEPLYLAVGDGVLEPGLLDGLYSRGFLDPCRTLVVLPIVPTTGHRPEDRDTALGFIVLGLNTRRPFDAEYQQFIKVLRRQVTTSLASVILLEEEIRRGRTIAEQAALDQRILEERLRERTAELEKRSLQLKQFTDCAGVGISVLEFGTDFPKGRYAYRNDKWWELTAGSKVDEEHIPVGYTKVWDRIHPDDLQQTRDNWLRFMSTRNSSSFVFRIRKDGNIVPHSENDWRWVLAYSLSVLDNEERLISVITSLTDITTQKDAEHAQERLAAKAIEAKRQQENFIDVTSHEMRNPLSAIMISADDILSSLGPLTSRFPELQEILRSVREAAQVIADCAQHQRRIVDDILTISKLDSGLFTFTPVATSVEMVINNLLKMIEPELSAGRMSRHLDIDPSFQILGIDQVMLDPSRLLQILINLLTNAVKFTKYAQKRDITIGLRASLVPPSRTMHGYQFMARRPRHDDLTSHSDWSASSTIYLEFSIEDTGRGLTMEEKEVLFQRFSQAPKTHVNYGGSGLGLFISRELVELQGGQIGVASEGQDKGCDFSFYIKARRADNEHSSLARDGHYSNNSHSQVQSTYAIRSVLDHESMDLDLTTPGLESPQSNLFLASAADEKPKHALIVEDNLVNQKVLKKQLEKIGYTVSIANHGQEALDFLLTTTFAKDHWPGAPHVSVVLMDSEMPVLDGLAAARQIREMERKGIFVRHVPIIAITANVRLEQVEEALAAGIDDVVAKPFRVPELVRQIEKLAATLAERDRDNG